MTHIRLNEAPATGDPTVFDLGLEATGVSVDDTEDGTLTFTKDDEQIEQTAQVAAWDARLDEEGDPLEVVPVDVEVEQTTAGRGGSAAEHVVRLTAPEELLSDPKTEFPVIIDPDIAAVSFSQDAWIRKTTTGNYGDDYRLLVGRLASSSNSQDTVSLAQWNNGELAGKTIVKAQLSLFQYAAGSCQDRLANIHPLLDEWDESTVRWSNRPPINTGTGTTGRLYKNVGGAGCSAPNGRVSVDITGMVQGWADGPDNDGFVNNGFQMNVPTASQTDVTYERRFCSSEFNVTHTSCNNADVVPRMSVTYNGPPGVPGAASTPSSRTFDGGLYAAGVRPEWSVTAVDPESSRLTYELELRSTPSGSVLGTCTTAQVASGGTAGCAPGVDLVDNDEYVLRARAVDEYGLESAWSDWQEFGSDQTAPGAVSITCTDYADDEWYEDNDPDSTTCTFTSTGSADFEWRRTTAGTVEDRTALPASSGAATTPSVDVPANGVMRVEARAKSKSGLASAWKSYTFGVGTSVLTEPLRDDRSTSTFPVAASAGEGSTGAVIQWRYAPDDEDDTTTGWTDATQVKKASDGSAWNGSVSGTGISQTPRLMWTPVQESGVSAPSVLQVRVVFTYPGDVKMPSPAQQIQVVPHAFGSSFPTKQVGPAEVGLFSGELRYSATDVDIPGPDDSLQFARTHLSLAGESAGAAGVLGPGWVADFGNGEGASGFVVLDRTGSDGTITLMSPQGESYTYVHSSGTAESLKTGTYKGIGETKLQKDTLQLATGGGTGYSHVLTLTERSGVKTEFKRTTAGVWGTERVIQPKDAGETTYVRNSAGLVTWVFSPYVSGLTCTTSTQQRGCRALRFTYTTVAGEQRLSLVEMRAWNPKPTASGLPHNDAAMGFREVARYSYDSNGYLTEQWAPLSEGDVGTTALKSAYEYDTTGGRTKLTKVTDPGLKPWRFDYDNDGRLATVKRQHDAAVGTGDATWTVKYEIPLSGGGLPDLTADEVASWGQHAADAPAGATAIWGPARVPGSSPSAADYEYAYLAYHSQAGRTVNAAEYGAGAWQIDTLRYDAHGNVVWQLGAAGRKQALAESSDPQISAGLADKYAAFTLYSADGSRVENTYSPMRTVVLDNGDTVVARTTTATDYDDEADASLMPGRPTSDVPDGGFDLPVEERVAVTDKLHPAATGNIWDSRATRYRYDKIRSADADTWRLGLPTRVLTEDGTGWATSLSRYDKYGYLIESRGPAGTATTDDTANDVRSTKYVYYTANADASVADCRNKPEWAGLLCQTKPGGNPSAGHPVPTIQISGYTMRWSITRTAELGDTAKRVSAVDYDYVGREEGRLVEVTGSGATSTAVADKTMSYSTSTGALTSIAAGTAGTESMTYDSWGRLTSRTDSTGNTSTTTYDTAARIATADDGKGVYTYSYDGTDSRGKKERRGKVTSLDVGLASGPDVITGAYDANGALVEQKLPGGVTAAWARDVTGIASTVSYEQGSTELMSFTQTYDHLGRVHTASGPDSTQRYGYDDRDRLTRVEDTYQGSCFVRTYGFDQASNRTSFKNYIPDANGGCQDTTAIANITTSFDTGDRITTSGYSHDKLGRATTVPAQHTNEATGSNLTVAYYANDVVRSLTQTVPDDESGTVAIKQEFTLDALDRISTTKGYTAGVQLSESTAKYAGSGDGPAWTASKTRPNASAGWTTTWTRNIGDLGGGLGILQSSDGTNRLQVSDLRGNIVASTTIGGTGLDSFTTYTEYGTARQSVPEDYEGYGWLGSHLRKSAGNVGGVTLMGARLYNPQTGRFLSRDPIPGGNDNAYVYPPDPVNKVDLDGRKWNWAGYYIVALVVNVVHKTMTKLGLPRPAPPKHKKGRLERLKDRATGAVTAARKYGGKALRGVAGGAEICFVWEYFTGVDYDQSEFLDILAEPFKSGGKAAYSCTIKFFEPGT